MSSLFKSTFNSRYLSGQNIPEHKYIRSDAPKNITSDEKDWLFNENFLTVIDLRSEWEKKYDPVPLEQDDRFTYLHMPATINGMVDINDVQGIVPKTTTDISKAYLMMADENMKNIIDTIMNSETNVIYFCSAGKDRTGVVSAILMLKYKESRNDIIKDYMASLDNVKTAVKEYIEKYPEIPKQLIFPEPQYIEQFIDNVDLKKINL